VVRACADFAFAARAADVARAILIGAEERSRVVAFWAELFGWDWWRVFFPIIAPLSEAFPSP
jgi:hypothetical protein